MVLLYAYAYRLKTDSIPSKKKKNSTQTNSKSKNKRFKAIQTNTTLTKISLCFPLKERCIAHGTSIKIRPERKGKWHLKGLHYV